MVSRILSNLPRWTAAAVLAFGLAACGGGGGMAGGTAGGPSTGPQGCSATNCGSALLTLTDGPGDFASYTVDVTSLKLTKADGTVVETLPIKTRVDFTQLVNVTEFLATATIPQGEYVSASMTLDYAKADINVYTDAKDSATEPVAQVIDSNKNVLWPTTAASSPITLSVKLDDKHHLFITPGKLARLALDFNLAASNSVDIVTNPLKPVVTLQAFIVADVVPTDTKDIRVRGALVSVDTSKLTYTVNVAPFDDPDSTDRGQVVVQTTAATDFEVDGKSYTGTTATTGIAALATALATDQPAPMTVAFGTLSTTDHTFTATRVLAGSSVEDAKLDRLHGIVTSRSAADSKGMITLHVRAGRMKMHADGDSQFFAKDVALSIGGNTVITVVGNPTATPDGSWPSVGSEITAFGAPGTDTNGNPTFDATAGRLRIELTTLWGTADQSGIGTNQVTLNLQSIEGLPVSAFDFTGTGSDPTKYIVATGALPLPALTGPTPLRFFGLVQPFGSAGSGKPDFTAQTLVDFANTSAVLFAGFGSGSTTGLSVTGTTSLTLDVKDPLLGPVHVIRIGPEVIDLTTLSKSLTILPDTTSSGPFAIRTESPPGMMTPDSIAVFDNFTDFATQLGKLLTNGSKVEMVLAAGQYDQTAVTFTARQIAVGLN